MLQQPATGSQKYSSSLLQTRPRWTGAELAERLEITERTLRRDIARLRTPSSPRPAVTGSRVRLADTDYHGTPSARVVEPHRLVHTGRRWYLVARDVDRDAWRSFRADRIRDPQGTGVRFVHQDPPNAVGFVTAAITTAPYQHRARILFHAPAPVVAEHIAQSVGVIEPAGEDEDKRLCMIRPFPPYQWSASGPISHPSARQRSTTRGRAPSVERQAWPRPSGDVS
jgi:hypothetical protein